LHYNIDIVGITKSKLLEKEFIEDKNNAFFCKGHEINLALQHYVGLAIKNTHLQQWKSAPVGINKRLANLKSDSLEENPSTSSAVLNSTSR